MIWILLILAIAIIAL
jgi:FtsZ-interacting cell division protein ZipA